jgi:hypothetical protein
MSNFIIDLHCHPAMRPYGKSFDTETPTQTTTNRNSKHSLWHYDPPTAGDKLLQRFLGLSKYSQSDFTTLAYGGVRCICASLYSIEKGLVDFNILGKSDVSDILINIISSLGKKRIDFLQANNDYFTDMENEYKFYLQLNNQVINFRDGARKYVLVKNFAHLNQLINEEPLQPNVEVTYVIITVEGMHDLNTGTGTTANEAEVLSNLAKMKAWEFRPFFVTFAHHFYNELCGHAESLSDFLQDFLTKQEPGMNTGFTALGWKVLKNLLDNNITEANGKKTGRIYIDVKHMSVQARNEYYNFLKTERADAYARKELPIIISHCACNGLMSAANPNPTPGLELTASRMYDKDINFYDDEIVEVKRSGGIIALQLDERRIASKQYKKSLRKVFASANKRMHSNSKMLWNNIQHIAQLLDKHDLFAWDCIAIGSDFDGVIDPINMFWSAEQMDDLLQYTERHAFNFFNDASMQLKNSFNKIEPAEVVDRIFNTNSMEFFSRYFK